MTTTGDGTARFAQLTYTSCDRGDRPGGWGVQDVAGALSAPERAELTRRVVPRFVPVGELPAFPDPAQLAARPARVVHAPSPGGGGAYWHTVACGTDAHGRPGNVFVHVLLDRGDDDAPDAGRAPARPSDLAAGGSWLRPYGPGEVAATALRDVPPPPWPVVPGRDDVLDFLFDEGSGGPGIATLCLLLDALDAALRGGPPVVLGLRDMGRAPLWVAVADHLMSVGAARRCGWSTYERVDRLREWPADLHLVVVPARDLDGARAAGAGTVLGEDEEVPRAELGGPARTTGHGSPVAVTPWSVMAFEVLADRVGAESLLARMDVAGLAVPEAHHPAWAMAAAVAQEPTLAPDAVPAAREVLEVATPRALAVHHPALYDHVLAVVAGPVAPGTAGAVAALHAAGGERRTILRDLALLRALDDPDAPADGIEDTGAPVATRVRERAGSLVATLLGQLDATRPERGADALARVAAVVDLLAAAGADLRADPAVTAFLDRAVGVLSDPGRGPSAAARLAGSGPVTRRAVDDAVRRRLRDDPAPAGTRLPPAVLGLLGVRLPRPDELVAGGPDELQRELAALATRADPDPGSAAWTVRAWDLLAPGGQGAAGPELTDLARAADDAAAARHARPGDLAVLLTHREHPVLHRAALRTLLVAPDDEHLDALVDAVLAPRPAGVERPRRLVDAARLRRLVPDADPERRDELVALAGSLLAALPPRAVARAVWRALLVALLVDATARAWHAVDPPGPAGHGGGWTAADRLPAPVRHGATSALGARSRPDPVVVAALADGPGPTGPALVHAALVLRLDDGAEGDEAGGLGEPDGGTGALRALAGGAHGTGALAAVLLAVARRRRAAGTLDEADRDQAVRGLRRRPREGRGLVRRRPSGDDPDAAVAQWWSEVVTAPSAATRD